MAPTILVCTIARNAEKVFKRYYVQLKTSVKRLEGQYNFLFSIYENDSSDDTKKLINSADWSFFPEWAVRTENIGTDVLTGTNPTRVENLAKARNKCLEAKDFLGRADWVIFVETDIEYTPDVFEKILLHNNQDVDIFSGLALVKDTRVGYDTWATRHSPESRGSQSWLGDGGVKEFWATFSCVCLYKAKPFQEGLRFHWINERIGTPDCDTTVICEIFRKNGYNKIIVDQDINPYHYLENLIMYAIKPGPGADALARFVRSACREHDDVVITANPVPTREYVFILNPDEVPHVMLIKSMDNNILRTKPRQVNLNVMEIRLGSTDIKKLYENGAEEWPQFEPRMYMRNPADGTDPIQVNPIGALSIWRVKNMLT
jgi:hypothetical protein